MKTSTVNLHNLCSLRQTNNNKPSQPNGASNSSNARLEIVHLNIRSLKNYGTHLSELRHFASERKTDFLIIFETWSDLELQIEGYKLYRLDHLHKKAGESVPIANNVAFVCMGPTLLVNNTQHCWAQHVASICMEPQQCWHLLRII